MSNELKLGTTPNGYEGRDAVHIAILPTQAAEQLTPGTPVRLNDQHQAQLCEFRDAIGIVDPFLKHRIVPKGQWFWLCLYPNTITGLRHVWQHPAVPEPLSPSATGDQVESQKWLTTYIQTYCPYWNGEPDLGYSRFIQHVKEREIFYCGLSCHRLEDVEEADLLFHHLSVVLNQRIDASYFEAFTCTC